MGQQGRGALSQLGRHHGLRRGPLAGFAGADSAAPGRRDGERRCRVIPKWLPRPDSPWATRLSVIEADRLETPPYLEGMARIRRGVELDGEGAPVAYHFRAAHPGDALYLRGDEAQDLNR